MKILIVDDERMACENLAYLLQKNFPEHEIIDTCYDADSALPYLKPGIVDIVLLDIQMPGMSGLELLEKSRYRNFKVIFITAYSEYALEAIKAGAIDYLLKPVQKHELYASLEKAEKILNTERSTSVTKLKLNSGKGFSIIDLETILRIKSDNVYCTIYFTDGTTLLVSKPILDFENRLPGNRFFRIHRSHIINVMYIKEYRSTEGGYVIMNNGDAIPVSRSKHASFKNFIKFLMDDIV